MSEFKKGDYIVTLKNDGDCGRINYCSKQREDYSYLRPEIDTQGDRKNGNCEFEFSDTSGTKWRYATKEEGEYYEVVKKPFDVTTIPKKPSFEVGKWYKVNDIWISKFHSLEGNKFWGEAINTESKFHDLKGWLQIYTYKLPTLIENLLEIQKYLPDGHPDKITNNTDAFKEGDKVKTPKGEGTVIARQKTTEGENYLVEHLENIGGHKGDGISIEWGNTGKDGYCWWYTSDYITLAQVEPYTVGGYIKVLAGYGNVGKVGKITKIVGNREIHTDIDYTSIEKAYFIKDTECEWIGMEKPVDIVVWDYKELRPEPTSEEFMKELEKSRHYFVDASDLVDKYGWEIPTPKKYDEEVLKQYVFGYDPFPKDELEFQEPVLIKKRKKSQLITI